MASLLTEVCPNVAIEPHLQPLSGKSFRLASTNTDDGARLDVRARGFWNTCQDAFFDLRVFHPNAPSNSTSSRSLPATYKKHEDEKKRRYGQRIYTRNRAWCLHPTYTLNIRRHGYKEAQTLYKSLADIPYCSLMGWLRCKLSFATLRSAVMCIRGSRSPRSQRLLGHSPRVRIEGRVPLES